MKLANARESLLLLRLRFYMSVSTGQDIMTQEKSRDEHMREATRYLNECEKTCGQEGIPPSQLFMLTRGKTMILTVTSHISTSS